MFTSKRARTSCTLITATLALLCFAGSASADECVELSPGKGIDELRLGMSETDKLLQKIKAEPGGIEGWFKSSRYEYQLSSGRSMKKVYIVRASLNDAKCVKLPGKAPLKADLDTLEALAAYVGECHPVQMNIGATVVNCADGVTLLQHRGGLDVQISQLQETASDKPVCAGYVAPGKGAFVPGRGKVDAISLEPGKTYCAGSRTLDTTVRPDDVLGKLRYNTCQTQANRGATTITCPYQGVEFVFAGPKLALHHLRSVPMKQ